MNLIFDTYKIITLGKLRKLKDQFEATQNTRKEPTAVSKSSKHRIGYLDERCRYLKGIGLPALHKYIPLFRIIQV